MSGYKIVSYCHDFAEEQAFLDIEVSKTWIMPDSTPVERLTEHYRNLNVDPELMLCCFLNGKMIGFTSNSVQDPREDGVNVGKMDFPVVLVGHEEVSDILYKRTIEAFRRKGVGVVKATFGLWGGSEEWAERWGFEKVDEIGVLYGLDVRSSNIPVDSGDVLEFDPENDLDQVVDFFSSRYNLPEDEVRTYSKRLYASENTLGYFVVRGNEGLLASGALGVNSNVPSLGFLSAVQDEGTSYLRTLMSQIVLTAKNNDIKLIHMFFTHLSPGHPLINRFVDLGFRYLGSNVNYEKKI
jgi:hypothetical protein